MSTHRIDVIRIGEIEKHPNADSLGLVKIEAFTCAVRLGDFQVGDLVAYIEPDYVVPPTEPFMFLCKDGKPMRIRAKRLRGTWSMGLLVRAPDGAVEGDDVMERMGIVRYEPSISLGADGDAEIPCGSLGSVAKYDLENHRRYGRSMFVEGETVIVTEKLHGENARFAFRDGRMWLGSRTQWKRADASHSWSLALAGAPWIEKFCRQFPDFVLYGEAYGRVPTMRYGVPSGQVAFRAFDVASMNRTWMDADAFVDLLPPEHRAPLVHYGPYSEAKMEELAIADSRLGGHLAEGIVIKPVKERYDPHNGRVALKLVSNRYLEKS